MGLPGCQMWTWTICVFFSWMFVGRAVAGPQYMVAIPATLESGAETNFCASLLQPNETLVMIITLKSSEETITLFTKWSNRGFHICTQFMVPCVKDEDVQALEVEVQGSTYHSKEVRKVLIKNYHPKTFVQTDKPIYLPGQTVHFRVVTLDSKLRPANGLYDVIEIADVAGNRIGQWLNETSDSKILQLSYALNSEAREGDYQVIVTIGSDKINHRFKVEKYVLPKFEIKINAPDEVSIDQEEIEAEVCATYTFEQPVPGSVEVKMCRPLNHYYLPRPSSNLDPEAVEFDVVAPCQSETKQADNKGCATFIFPMSAFTRVAQKVLQDELKLQVKVEEGGTGISHKQEQKITISYVVGKLSFTETPKIYDRGSNLEGKVQAVHYNKTPIADMPLYLFEGENWSGRRLQNLTTNSDGVASFSINTAEFERDLQLRVTNLPIYGHAGYRTPFYEAAELSVSLSRPSTPHSKTVSFLELKKKDNPLPCYKEEVFTIQYTVVGEARGSVDVMYLVLTRGAIVMNGVKRVRVQESLNEGEVSFRLMVSPDMAPDIQVVAYAILPSENVMAKSADFSVEKCFVNEVSLEFSPSSAVPGEEAILKVSAQPDSLCGVSAVDQSVLIKEPGMTLEADKIFDLLPVKKASFIPYMVQDSIECLHVRPRRSIMPYPDEQQEDPHTVFQNVGMKMATNLLIRVPSCLKYKGREFHHGRGFLRYSHSELGGAGGAIALPMEAVPSPIETVRTFFPETWIWDLVAVGESGVKDVSLTVPDTITTWETEAFCLSPQGFGLAPRKEITVFQPFFLELTLPYSTIRGEHFELKATVFSYMSSCIMVTVAPVPSLEYTLTPLSGDQYTACLCGNLRRTVSWTMAPSALGVVNVTVSAEAVPSHVSCDNEVVSVPKRGRKDTVTRSLIVKAEGVETSKTFNWLLCPKGESLKEEVDIQLPEDVIVGSARASVSVLGDILGRALNNLDGLLQMPYGCGEQNMALLAPNTYILQYLKDTQQLTPAIKDKATKFLTSGYQRQLNYRHGDGAYSTFGSGSGNTWLTAFVVRSFTKAQSFVFIDPKTIEGSVVWLKSKQKENGCFQQSGKLFNNRMKGGVSDEVTLSAYITAAFLEMNTSADDPEVKKSLSCLRESLGNHSNSYTTALLAYVFTLAGDMEARAQLLKHLDSVAIQQGGFLHWAQTASGSSASLSVEISSYVLLAKLSASPTTEDLGYAARIVRWLASQQNHYGGFSSTQDTVVALQALALYSTLVFSAGGSSTVTVQSPSGQLTFEVNQNNKLLYQETELQDTTGKFSLEVKGTTCAVMQISLHYNIPPPADVTTLSVEVTPKTSCTDKSPKISLMIKTLYSGEEHTTNMVILDVKMLSGYIPDPASLQSLKGAIMVDRVDQNGDHVLVYIEELQKDIPIFYKLDLLQELPVQNLKPAVVKIYDYYQPSDHDDSEYSSPCVAG